MYGVEEGVRGYIMENFKRNCTQESLEKSLVEAVKQSKIAKSEVLPALR